jgi:hypothetical protein
LLLFGIRRPARTAVRKRPTSPSRAPAVARPRPAPARSTRAAPTAPRAPAATSAERATPAVSRPPAATDGQRAPATAKPPAVAARRGDVAPPPPRRRSAGAGLAPVAASRAAIAGVAGRVRRKFEDSGITRTDLVFYAIGLIAAIGGSAIALWAAQR